VVQSAQTYVFATYSMGVVKKRNGRYKGQPSFLLKMRHNVMETILIILLVVFLVGGGGWGYRRWRS